MKLLNFLKDKRHTEYWLYIVITQPNVYLKNLVKRTVLMGLFLALIHLIAVEIGVKENAIPSNMHGLIGVVIGLSLSFRTSTAYDRWWEARKVLSELKSNLIYITIKLKRLDDTETEDKIVNNLLNINRFIFEFIKCNNPKLFDKIRTKVYKEITTIQNKISSIDSIEAGNSDRKLAEIITCFSNLERIKNTPIPQSYAIHIKMSIFAYLLSLPFGLFFSMGALSIPLVMLLYFIIAGIEIIATEIENPFGESANDLPMDRYKKQNEDILKSI